MRTASNSSTTTDYFWKASGVQNYPMLPDPDIPGSRYGIVKQYSVDSPDQLLPRARADTLDGIFLDNIGLTYANVENYRKPLWAYLEYAALLLLQRPDRSPPTVATRWPSSASPFAAISTARA